MKHINKFINNESGAVTVDWVVLTAAIVGIAIAVIALISSGIKDASTDINSELQSAGTGWSFLDQGTSTFGDFLDSYAAGGGTVGYDPMTYDAVQTAIIADAPDGYTYSYEIDDTSGTPVYTSGTDVSVNGEVMTQQEYLDAGNTTTDDFTVFSNATIGT